MLSWSDPRAELALGLPCPDSETRQAVVGSAVFDIADIWVTQRPGFSARTGYVNDYPCKESTSALAIRFPARPCRPPARSKVAAGFKTRLSPYRNPLFQGILSSQDFPL